jgi:futalosine hydrolase
VNVLLVTATETEAAVFRKYAVNDSLRNASPDSPGLSGRYAPAECPERSARGGSAGSPDLPGNFNLSVMVTGIGSVATAWALTRRLCSGPRPDLVINAGIAGSFRDSIRTGDVVMPLTDCFADAGVESAEGFLTLSEAGLQDPDSHPFTGGRINAYSCPAGFQYPGPSVNRGERTLEPDSFLRLAAANVRPVRALTVNTVTGTAETAGRLMRKYDPDIETMEGAAFFYVCSREGIPFIALRAVSNRVGVRDRAGWNIPLALENLALLFEDLLKKTLLKR